MQDLFRDDMGKISVDLNNKISVKNRKKENITIEEVCMILNSNLWVDFIEYRTVATDARNDSSADITYVVCPVT